MTPQVKKYTVFVTLFVLWLVADLWTKDWADRYLSERNHPASIRVGDADAGKTVAQLVAAYYDVDESMVRETLGGVLKSLPEPLAFKPSDKVFSASGPHGKSPAYYAYWRGDDMPPVLLDKYEPNLLGFWLQIGRPKSSGQELRKAVDERLAQVTMSEWLLGRIRGLSADDVGNVKLYPYLTTRPVSLDTTVQAGQVVLVSQREIDVMGDWFKYRYRENPGAAFGFMRDVEPKTRSMIFFILTLVALTVIGTITLRLPPSARLVNVAMAGILAGAIGNFVNRLELDYVIDFIDMDLGFYHWPTYNIADIGISVGVVLLLSDMLFNKDSVLAGPKEEAPSEASLEKETEPHV